MNHPHSVSAFFTDQDPSKVFPVFIIFFLTDKKEKLTAFNFFVGRVGAVTNSIAKFGAFNALGPASGRSLRTEELVVGATDKSAISFVRIIRAVGEAVTSPPVRKAKAVVAPELAAVTRREICNKFKEIEKCVDFI